MTAALTAEGLGFRHARTQDWALQDVTLSVEPGEVLAVVGPSGSGKTTLLRLVCGLLTPSSGRLLLAGVDAAGLPPERRPVAMVFQGFALFPHLTVRENIAFGLTVRRVARTERARRAEEAAGALQVDRLLDRLPGELSGGERQRVALARALVRDPRVFCLDEPLSSLDPILRVEARRALSGVLRADDRCAVYVTHDQSEAVAVGDRVAVLHDGRLEQVATPRVLHASPATSFVARFVGSPPMSLLTSVGGRAGPVVPPFPVGDGTLLGVRAEHVVVGEGMPLVVRDREDAGHEQLVALDVAGEDLLVRVPLDLDVQVGSRLDVRIDPALVRAYDPVTGRLIA